MVSKPGFAEYCDPTVSRDAYGSESSNRQPLWWYQSCASHGCNTIGGEYFRNWPSYVIDTAALANRIMPWISWKYGIEGELYYATNQAEDPWKSAYLFGGNGDGTLFYPGRAERIGGRRDIPIESLRLKLIREGLEDYEYLKLLSERGQLAWANEQVSRLVRAAYDWEQDADRFFSIRRALGERLEATSSKDSAR
jgi:hypothetical protein